MLNATDETLRAYEQRADRYFDASAPAVSAEVAGLLDAVVARLHPGSHVLEVGTGPGREAAYLEERGLHVDRTDATAAFVERLRADGHDARLLDVRDGNLGGPYDAVLANAVLLHLDRAQARLAVEACRQAVRPGGLFALTLKDGDGAAPTAPTAPAVPTAPAAPAARTDPTDPAAPTAPAVPAVPVGPA